MGFDFSALASPDFELPEGWRVVSVQDVAKVNEMSIQDGYEHSRIEYIDIASVEKGVVRVAQDLLLAEAPSRARRVVRDNDTLISTVRPNLEHYAFIKKAANNAVASTGFAVVTAKDVDPRWLYYSLTTKQVTEYLSRIADSHTSAYPAFNPDVIEKLELPFPSSPEQRTIAYILGTLDDKIELNRRMNETLEAIAQAIFKSWFVDGIADGIPKGWREGTVSEDFEITMGQSPPGETYNEAGKGLPFFQGRVDFGFRFPTLRVYCTAPTRKANPGDTLVCVRAPVGDLNMAAHQCCIGRGLAAVRHKTGSRSYTYYAMHALRKDFDRFEAEGTVFGSMGKKDFHAIRYVVPPEEKVKDFESLVGPLDQLIDNNEQESRTLAAIRDALLPKLLSGEIRVGENAGASK